MPVAVITYHRPSEDRAEGRPRLQYVDHGDVDGRHREPQVLSGRVEDRSAHLVDALGQRAVQGGGQGHGHPHLGAFARRCEPAGRGPGTGGCVRGLPQYLRRGALGDPQVPVRVGQGQQPPEPYLCPDDVHDAVGE